MRFIFLLLFFFCTSVLLRAQKDTLKPSSKDSIDRVNRRDLAIENAAILNPRVRQFFISHEEQGMSNITSSTKDGTVASTGKLRIERTRINMNMPIFQRQNSSLTSSYGFVNQVFHMDEMQTSSNSVLHNTTSIPMLTAGLTYMNQIHIFQKDVTLIGMANGIFNTSFNRAQFTFMAMANVPLKRTENTNMSVGAIFMYDPSSPIPFFLTFNYYHKFKSANMDLMFDAPYRLALRKTFTPKFSLSFSNEMVGYNSFFDQKNLNATLPQKLIFSYLEVKSGLLAEYRLSKKAFISLSSGVNLPLKSRILNDFSKPNDYLIKNKLNPVPYVQVGFSLLPFWKGLNL